jgi:hypothetical protein
VPASRRPRSTAARLGAGLAPDHLEAVLDRASEIRRLDREHAAGVGEVEDRDDAGRAGPRILARFGIDEPHARPGRNELAPRAAGIAEQRVVELRAEFRHPVLVDDALGRDGERVLDAEVERVARHLARAALEAARLHHARTGWQRDAHAALGERVEQVDERERRAAERHGDSVRRRLLQRSDERADLQRSALHVEAARRVAQFVQDDAEHVGERRVGRFSRRRREHADARAPAGREIRQHAAREARQQ